MLKNLAILIAVVIAVGLGFAATRPDSFRVERTATIAAAPEKIFPLINDFHAWPAWSPWERLDPDLKRSYSGNAAGTGAAYQWVGNSKVGSGRMEVVDSQPSSSIRIKLDFLEPIEGHNTTEFTLKPNGDGTDVTWAMYGPSPYLSKVMSLVFNMDSMIGDQFATGLENLKQAAAK